MSDVNLAGGVLLNRLKPKVTIEFTDNGQCTAKFEQWPRPMTIGMAHVLQDGSLVLVLEPQRPPMRATFPKGFTPQ